MKLLRKLEKEALQLLHEVENYRKNASGLRNTTKNHNGLQSKTIAYGLGCFSS